MRLIFERGDESKPKGHAIIYWGYLGDPSKFLATYLAISPLEVDLEYLEKAATMMEIHSQLPLEEIKRLMKERGGMVSPTGILPPMPVTDIEELKERAEERGDDLINAGVIYPFSDLKNEIMRVTHEYGELYSKTLAEKPLAKEKIDVDELIRGMLPERDRLGYLSRLTGRLRDAVNRNDSSLIKEVTNEMMNTTKYLSSKYRIPELIEAAKIPGEKGQQLTQLYIDMAYKLCDEKYQEVKEIDDKIKAIKQI
ncbi:MAG: hypothetical protein QMD14_03090 [Candidatus Aenigmarchaeota archaeon]|nr:hypothetical protein [Candidatus Aenigmarchaeota archaeon]